MPLSPRVALSFALLIASLTSGCASYRAPGMSADFHALGITPEAVAQSTDASIAGKLNRKPLAGFPTNIAVVRLQGNDYQSYTNRGWGDGQFTVVTTRDVETEDAFEKLKSVPMVAGVAPLNRLVLPHKIDNEETLRGAAASVQADMLLLYTFDTTFATDKERFAPLALLSLGLFPDRQARVNSTASAALIDTRNGFVYGLAEGNGQEKQVANAWSNEQAIDKSRRKAEQQAFINMSAEVEHMVRDVVKRYGPPETAVTSRQE
jgi:hypothetical protein